MHYLNFDNNKLEYNLLRLIPYPAEFLGELNEVDLRWEEWRWSSWGRIARRMVFGGHHGHFETLTARRSPEAMCDSHNTLMGVEKVWSKYGEVS